MVHLHLKHLPWEQKLFLYVWWYSLWCILQQRTCLFCCLSQQQECSQLCPRVLNEHFPTLFPLVTSSFGFPWNFLMISVNVTRVGNIHANTGEGGGKEQQRTPSILWRLSFWSRHPHCCLSRGSLWGRSSCEGPHTRGDGYSRCCLDSKDKTFQTMLRVVR